MYRWGMKKQHHTLLTSKHITAIQRHSDQTCVHVFFGIKINYHTFVTSDHITITKKHFNQNHVHLLFRYEHQSLNAFHAKSDCSNIEKFGLDLSSCIIENWESPLTYFSHQTTSHQSRNIARICMFIYYWNMNTDNQLLFTIDDITSTQMDFEHISVHLLLTCEYKSSDTCHIRQHHINTEASPIYLCSCIVER